MPEKKNNFFGEDRKDFRARLDNHLHPSRHIELPNQLYGRGNSISSIRDAFETSGTHPFVWGPRGIGKTSLGHTACEILKEEVILAATVSCTKEMSFRDIIDDIISDALARHPSILGKDKKIEASLNLIGIQLSTEISGIQSARSNLPVNQAASMLDSVFNFSRFGDKLPVILVDEFDRLHEKNTFSDFADLLKQLSAQNCRVKFCFCGITDDLGELLEAHESVDRYIYGIELEPLSYDSIWQLVKDAGAEFALDFHRGQEIRISQIAAGYPHFAHLILKNTILAAYEEGYEWSNITHLHFREGLNRSAQQAATRLRTQYEAAIRKGTDRYVEVLFAAANSQHLNRQFKEIVADYERIMLSRPSREGYDVSKNNAQDLRNALESLCKREFLRKGKTGWYQFVDPMLRSYVRLIAETQGVELSDDSFPA